jgi:hypothetical protein
MTKLLFLFLSFLQPKDTKVELDILVSKNNNIFFYQAPLKNDASNFKVTTYKTFPDVILVIKSENHIGDFNFILKIQQKDSMNEDSKKLVEFIEQQKHFNLAKLTEPEALLIKLTEQSWLGVSPKED